jgi:hypothetical protein
MVNPSVAAEVVAVSVKQSNGVEPAGGLPPELMAYLDSRFSQLQAQLDLLIQQRTIKSWYGTEEVAEIVGKAEFTVREWCRNGRIHAEKQGSGRGKYQSWVISQEELQRFQKEGLLTKRKS